MNASLTRCPHCDAVLRAGAVRCAACNTLVSAPVRGATDSAVSAPPRAKARSAPPTTASTSALAYMFADRLVPEQTTREQRLTILFSILSWGMLLAVVGAALALKSDVAPANLIPLIVPLVCLVVLASTVWPLAIRVVPHLAALRDRENVAAPCSGQPVSKQRLATTLMAAALLSLRAQGFIALELPERHWSLRLLAKRRVWVTRLQRGAHGGFEDDLVRGIAVGDSVAVYDLIRRWFHTNREDPWNDIFSAVIDEVPSQDCTDVAAFEAEFRQFAARWYLFQTDERALYTALLGECWQGIASRKDVPIDWDSD